MPSLTRPQRRWLRILISVVFLALGAWLGGQWLARSLRERSLEVVKDLCGPDSRITIGTVRLDLFAGNVAWTNVSIQQNVDSGDTTWTSERRLLISGHVDSISVRGAGLLSLAFGHTLRVRSLTIVRPQLILLIGGDTIASGHEVREPSRINAFSLDSLSVTNGSLISHNVEQRSVMNSIGAINLNSSDITGDLPNADQSFRIAVGTAVSDVSNVSIAMPPLYDLRVANLQLDHAARTASVAGTTLTPRKGPQDYHTLVQLETDLFTLHTDTVQLHGFDLTEYINTNILDLDRMRVAHSSLHAYRDKNMPDAPFAHKALPAGLLRKVPFAVRMDSLMVDGLDVQYLEKNDMSAEFGEITFTDIHGVVTGLNTIAGQDTGQVQLLATGRVFEQAAVTFRFATVPSDTTDRFTVQATISNLPFHVFNRMTDDLLNVRATAGTIGGMDLTMTGDDQRAAGRLDMEYAGLVVKIQSRDGERRAKRFLSSVVNRILRDENLRSSDNFRHGDFAVERRRDRAIFNYLWRGIRAGMMATVLPDVLNEATKDKPGK